MAEEEKPEEQPEEPKVEETPEAAPEEVKEEPTEKIEETSEEPETEAKPEAAPEEVKEQPAEKKEEEPKKEKPVLKSEVLDEIKKALGDKVMKAWVQRERRLYIAVKGENILEVAKAVKEMGFDHLSSISGVEYEDRMECVYHIWSYSKGKLLTVRTLVPKDDPKIDSLTSIWKSADWHERETYDLIGMVFEGHPDLRRILTSDDFKGHPLRKDFELTEKPW
ncbi:MAG: NADH-quinone oxidoreductase subunit C [Candidatus Hydrothermarchaeaceae archaeon]